MVLVALFFGSVELCADDLSRSKNSRAKFVRDIKPLIQKCLGESAKQSRIIAECSYLKDVTCIAVTHNPELFNSADTIVERTGPNQIRVC